MRKRSSLMLFLAAIPVVAQEHAPKNELAFQLSGLAPVSRNSDSLRLSAGVALQSNYGRRVFEQRSYAIYGEVHLLANPLRDVSAPISTATRDVASLYVMPGVRVKLAPLSRFSPYIFAGGGLAWYEQSTQNLGGSANAAPRETVRGGFDFGGGADLRVWRWLALRGEIRDFYTGSPAYNVAASGGQHNLAAGAGFRNPVAPITTPKEH